MGGDDALSEIENNQFLNKLVSYDIKQQSWVMFKFSKAWWCCLSDKSNQVPLTYCRILFYTRQLKFPLHIYLVLFFRFAHCSVGFPLTISNLQKRKINSSQSTNICVTALLEYQTKLLSPSMLLLLLIFMLWLLFFCLCQCM